MVLAAMHYKVLFVRRVSAYKQRLPLLCGKVAELSGFQGSKLEVSDANPHQPLYRAVKGI